MLAIPWKAHAAIAHDTSVATARTTSGTTFTTTLTTHAVNEAVAIFIVRASSVAVSSVSGGGLTWASAYTNGTTEDVWWAYSAGIQTSQTITVTIASTNACGTCIDSFSGTTTTPFEALAQTVNTATTTPSGAVTTITANALVMSYNIALGIAPVYTAGTGYTIGSQNAGTATAIASEYANSATVTPGSVTAGWTLNTVGNSDVVSISIKPLATVTSRRKRMIK
jgi:hypothetical protein